MLLVRPGFPAKTRRLSAAVLLPGASSGLPLSQPLLDREGGLPRDADVSDLKADPAAFTLRWSDNSARLEDRHIGAVPDSNGPL